MSDDEIYLMHMENDEWSGHNTLHATEASEQHFYRAFMIMGLVDDDLSSPRVAQLESLDEDDLYEIYQDERERGGFYEAQSVLSLSSLQDGYAAYKAMCPWL